MTAEATILSRREAMRILEQSRSGILTLVDRLPRRAMTLTGIGGGEWSPKDLLGHLASWEEYALDAVAAWDRGERAPIDDLTWSISTSRINRQNVEAKAPWPPARVRRESERSFAELISAIEAMTDARWKRPATARGRKPLAVRIGGILGGPAGIFRHDDSHHPSLRTFVESHASGSA